MYLRWFVNQQEIYLCMMYSVRQKKKMNFMLTNSVGIRVLNTFFKVTTAYSQNNIVLFVRLVH